MVQKEYRVVLATLAVFVALAGLLIGIHGLLFDHESVLRYGAAAVVAGVASFVLLLNPASNLDDDAMSVEWAADEPDRYGNEAKR
jgi:hypothetical protein